MDEAGFGRTFRPAGGEARYLCASERFGAEGMTELNGKPVKKDKEQGGKDDAADRPGRKWYSFGKRIYAVLGVVAVVGGVLAFGNTADHWFTGLSRAADSTCGLSVTNQIDRSPKLGISFHQDNQVALMDYTNSTGLAIPLIDVCLSSAPFEIWFPTLASAQADVEVCVSTTPAEFRINPFKLDGGDAVGCLIPGAGVADYSYASGFLSEASLTEPALYDIEGKRAAPASGGDEMYFVSKLYSPAIFTGKGSNSKIKFRTIPMAEQTANLYVIIYATSNYSTPPSDQYLEHYVLHFK
jgi:hypothetical protein